MIQGTTIEQESARTEIASSTDVAIPIDILYEKNTLIQKIDRRQLA